MLWGLLHPQTNKSNDPSDVPAKRFKYTHSGDDLRRRSTQMAKNLADLTGARATKHHNGNGHGKAKGLRFGRFFTPPGSHAYDLLEWEQRTAAISGAQGQVIVEHNVGVVPHSRSLSDFNVITQKYLRD